VEPLCSAKRDKLDYHKYRPVKPTDCKIANHKSYAGNRETGSCVSR